MIVGKKIEIEVYPEGLSYYSKIDGLYYKLNLNNNGITLEDAISELPQGVNSIELTAVSDSINNVKVDLNSENNSITLTGIAELTTLENFLCRQRLCLFNIR